MPEIPCKVNHFSLQVAFLRGLLGLLLPTTAWASDHIIKVRPPSGIDDTAIVQGALDAAVTNGPGTIVQLAPGTYRTRQLLTFNFHGTFKGAGKDRTTIEALPNLVSDVDNCDGYRLLDPNAKNWRWPSFILFMEGDIALSDLSVKFPATSGTAIKYLMCGYDCRAWYDGIHFTGQHPMNVSLDRIALEGQPDLNPGELDFGFNVINGIVLGGDLLQNTPEVNYVPLRGNFAMRNCEVRSVTAGFCNNYFFKDSRVTVGGSPSTGNVFESCVNGLDVETAENSRFEISHNRSTGSMYGMSIFQYYGGLFVPTKPSQFFVHDNHFTGTGTGPGTQGLYLMNDPEQNWIQARVFNNTVETPNNAGEGIGAYNLRGAFFVNNTLTGSGNAAIGLWGSSLCTVFGNALGGFFADPAAGLAKIYLDPATNHSLVFCANPLDTVLDQGTDNKVIGGWQQAAAAKTFVQRAVPMAGPQLKKRLRALR